MSKADIIDTCCRYRRKNKYPTFSCLRFTVTEQYPIRNRTFELLRIVPAWCARNCIMRFSIESFKYNIIFRRRYDTYSGCTQLQHVYYMCLCVMLLVGKTIYCVKNATSSTYLYIYVSIICTNLTSSAYNIIIVIESGTRLLNYVV